MRKTIVVKSRDLPLRHVVAGLARYGEAGRPMIQGRCLKILRMATDALRAQSRIYSRRGAFVAGIAGGCRVSAEQRKTVPVIPYRLRIDAPAAHGVAVLALSAELPAVEISVTGRALRSSLVEDFRYVT